MKMIRKKGMTLFVSILMIFTVSSCDLFDLDINTNPNSPSQASLELLLTNVMLDCSSTFAGGLNDATMGFMGQTTSTDDHNMTNQSWNGTWNFLYSGPLNDLERIIVATEAAGNNPRYLGIAQVLKAYYFSLMVDLWGDVPYFEAFKGDAGIKEPAYSDDQAIYTDLIALLDKAVVNLDATSAVTVTGDVIYGGSVAAWRRAAISLKLRLLLQTSAVNNNTAAITALINGGGYITTAAQDFQFRFGRLQNPDDRHPMYQGGYSGGEAGYTYFGHQLMVEMLEDRDPRTPYYFKRQTSAILDQSDPTDKQTTPCSQRDDCVYGYLVLNPPMTNRIFGKDPENLTSSEAAYLAGFFGRDRADPSGVPNDNPIRTTVGAYPAGGLFDDIAEAGGGNKGTGDGIFPMITSWMVKFYVAEAMIRLGVAPSAGPFSGTTETALLRAALTEQITKVETIGSDAPTTSGGNNSGGWPITYKTKATFVNDVVAAYPTASGAPQRLQYLLKQAWFCNFGNGFETYNSFRRTGFPNDLQQPLQLPRQFALRLPYAQDELNLNANTPDIVYDNPNSAVFWDNLKFQFTK